jgi:hypothetical protein
MADLTGISLLSSLSRKPGISSHGSFVWVKDAMNSYVIGLYLVSYAWRVFQKGIFQRHIGEWKWAIVFENTFLIFTI